MTRSDGKVASSFGSLHRVSEARRKRNLISDFYLLLGWYGHGACYGLLLLKRLVHHRCGAAEIRKDALFLAAGAELLHGWQRCGAEELRDELVSSFIR